MINEKNIRKALVGDVTSTKKNDEIPNKVPALWLAIFVFGIFPYTLLYLAQLHVPLASSISYAIGIAAFAISFFGAVSENNSWAFTRIIEDRLDESIKKCKSPGKLEEIKSEVLRVMKKEPKKSEDYAKMKENTIDTIRAINQRKAALLERQAEELRVEARQFKPPNRISGLFRRQRMAMR